MLGSAPGTDLLNQWVAAMLDDGMSIEDIANHIASSDAFLMAYPRFLSNEDFATDFLNNLMGSEEVPDALMSLAVDLVVSLLNDGMSRGELALAAVMALYDIHDQGEAHPSYGDLGMVAMAFANKIEVADYYTVDLRQANPNSRVLRDIDSETGLDDIRDSIGDYLDPPDPILLTSSRDDIEGTMAPDLIISEPDSRGEDTMDPFDVIDGGAGDDTFRIYASEGIMIDVNGIDVMNVENAYLSARQAINVNLSEWEGLEAVTLARFGNDSDVSVTVDGASVSTARTFGGDVTLVGVAGEVDLTAGKTSAVMVGSGSHTTSVMTKGGMSVDVNKTGAGGQSDTVTSVMIDDVQRGLGSDDARGTEQEPVEVTVSATNGTDTASATQTQYGTHDGSSFTPIADDADNPTTTYYVLAEQPEGLSEGAVVVTTDAEMARMQDMEGAADTVSVKIMSDAIEHVSLSNNDAIVLVQNDSDDPEDLSITVNKFGKHAKGATTGMLSLAGDGSPENVMIDAAGDSEFDLAAGKVKALSVSGAGKLTLGVKNAAGDAASGTLESLTLGGSGMFTMDAAGLKLKTIDGSASSGGSSIKGVGDSVTSITGGSGADSLTVAKFASGGLTVDLGAGNDTFSSAGGHPKSRVDGGEGMDVLHLTGVSATHGEGDDKASIFSNFEALEVGGSAAATHDISLLGVQAVSVSGSTSGAVTFENMGDGMGIAVNGKAGMGTMATVVHDMKDRSARDARYSGELEVSLTANGHKDDSATMGTGTASLTLTVDKEIEILDVASSAKPSGKAAAAAYRNTLTLMGDEADGTAIPSSVEAIVVSGSAAATISLATSAAGTAAQFVELEQVDAGDNTGGVTFSADLSEAQDGSAALTQKLQLTGGSGKDMFTGGGGVDTLMGNGGDDTLNGGAEADTITGGAGGDTLTGDGGADMFKYGSASESRVMFSDKGMSGFDTITDFLSGTDKLSLGKTLFGSLQGTIRAITGDDAVNSIDNDDAEGATGDEEDPTHDSLKAFLDGFKTDGVFETRGTVVSGTLGQGELIKHSIATVTETYWTTVPVAEDPDTTEVEAVAGVSAVRTWVLIDVDGDGDFSAATDMAIALTGTITLSVAAGDISA